MLLPGTCRVSDLSTSITQDVMCLFEAQETCKQQFAVPKSENARLVIRSCLFGAGELQAKSRSPGWWFLVKKVPKEKGARPDEREGRNALGLVWKTFKKGRNKTAQTTSVERGGEAAGSKNPRNFATQKQGRPTHVQRAYGALNTHRATSRSPS